jgi:RNA polymerase sigma factor (sigma-70 family)
MTALEGKALLDHGTAIARRYAGRVGAEMAEELRAEAVLRALRSPPPDGRVEPWLERIFRNLVVDRWRRAHATADLDLDEVAGGSSPEQTILGQERRRVVRAGLRELPREARRALLGRYYAELDDGLVAARLGVSATTVRTRIHRALARLRLRVADLRAWFPPLLGKLGAQAMAVGAAPLLVAALVVAGATVEPPTPQSPTGIATTPTTRTTGASVAIVPDTTPAPVPVALVTRPPKRPAAHVTHQAPAEPPLAPIVEDDPPVTPLLEPDGIHVFVEVEAPQPPCLVQAPPELLAQIEKMIEEQL